MSVPINVKYAAAFKIPDAVELVPSDKYTPLPTASFLLENFSAEELESMCVLFREGVFKKAGKRDPASERPQAIPHWKEAYAGPSLLQLLLVIEARINSFTREMENSYECAIAGSDFSRAYEELRKVFSLLQEVTK